MSRNAAGLNPTIQRGLMRGKRLLRHLVAVSIVLGAGTAGAREVAELPSEVLSDLVSEVEQSDADRDTKAPFDPKSKLHASVKREAMARGLLVYPMGGTVEGVAGDHVLLAPPFIVDAAVVDTIVERLGDAIDAATAKAG